MQRTVRGGSGMDIREVQEQIEKMLAIPMQGDHMCMGNEEWASWVGVNKVEGRE